MNTVYTGYLSKNKDDTIVVNRIKLKDFADEDDIPISEGRISPKKLSQKLPRREEDKTQEEGSTESTRKQL